MDIRKRNAWLVHAFTASGVVFALLALLAVIEKRPDMSLIWIGVALLVDGFDGTLARRFDVKNQIKEFDGSILDLIIDYLSYVFVPALFIYFFVPLPAYTAFIAISIILLSSFFCFCNVNMKSSENYFVGFPATWNVVILYFVVLNLPSFLNLVAILGLSVLSVVPVKFLHPFRVRKAMPVNIIFTLIWLIMSAFLIAQYQAGEFKTWTLTWWWISGIYFIGFGFIQTLLGKAK